MSFTLAPEEYVIAESLFTCLIIESPTINVDGGDCRMSGEDQREGHVSALREGIRRESRTTASNVGI